MFDIGDVVEYGGRVGKVFSLYRFVDGGHLKHISVRFDDGEIVTINGDDMEVVELIELAK